MNSFDNFTGGPTQDVARLGEFLHSKLNQRKEQVNFYSSEDAKRSMESLDFFNKRTESVMKANGWAKEDLSSDNNASLYTTVVADFIERALRPELVGLNVVKRLRIDNRGTSSIKIPVSQLLDASDLPDNGNVTYNTGKDYTSVTITLGWRYAAQRITMELIEQANVDLIQDNLLELGYSLSRKIDSDVIAAHVTATPSDDSNSNYVALGVTTNVSYDALIEGLASASQNNAKVDTVLMSWTQFSAFMKDTDVKTALGFNSTTMGSVFPQVVTFAGLRVIPNNQVADNDIFLIDSSRNGYFVEASDVKVYNDRVSGALAQEVIVAKNYGVAIVQPKTVFRLVANTA